MNRTPPLHPVAAGMKTALARGDRGRRAQVAAPETWEFGTGFRAGLLRKGVVLVWRPGLPSFERTGPAAGSR
ncbi:MAG: hypothetical protein ACRDON_09140 [Gaiellaceae bacterium]